MTEEEKQMLMAMMMRQEEPQISPEMGGEMIPLGEQGASQDQYSEFSGEPAQSQSGMSPMQMQQFAGAPAAGTAGGPLTAAEAANQAIPILAPDSLAAGSNFAPMASSAPAAAPAAAPVAAAPAASGGMGAGVGAGGGGMGSMMAAAAPWAALVAAAAFNERDAKKHGRRSDDDLTYAGDLLSGAVAFQDMQSHGDKVGGPAGNVMSNTGKFGEKLLSPWNLKSKDFKPWEWF